MSDRIAVMSAGKVQQIGSAVDIYEFPENRFVAGFIGETNLIEAEVIDASADALTCQLVNGAVLTARSLHEITKGQKGWVSIRPERMTLSKTKQGKFAQRHPHRCHLSGDGQPVRGRTDRRSEPERPPPEPHQRRRGHDNRRTGPYQHR